MWRLGLSALGLTGCFAAPVDFSRVGLFGCEEDPERACEDGGVCSAGRCYPPDEQPQVEIVSPEVPAFSRLADNDELIAIDVRLVSNASLSDVAVGDRPAGFIEVEVDGEVMVAIDGGDASGGLTVPIVLRNEPGVHRISARLLQRDGAPYDNDAAFARLLYFVAVGDEPYVGLLRPWPGDRFNTNTQEIQVAVQAFNFAIVPAGIARSEGRGHAHLHYGEVVEACHLERACDAGAISVVDRALDNGVGAGVGLFPSDEPGDVAVGVVLRNVDHAPYLVPFAECDALPPPPSCGVITDTIHVEREDEP